MPTKDELQRENDELRRELAEARAAGAAPAATNYKPSRPFLSEGERQDLEMYGATNSPFTGELITATGEKVKPRTETARRNDERANRSTVDRGDVLGLDRIPVDQVVTTDNPASTPDDEQTDE